MEFIFNCDVVKLVVVNTEMQGSIFLFYQKDKRGKWASVGMDYRLVQHFFYQPFNLGFEFLGVPIGSYIYWFCIRL